MDRPPPTQPGEIVAMVDGNMVVLDHLVCASQDCGTEFKLPVRGPMPKYCSDDCKLEGYNSYRRARYKKNQEN